MFSNGVPLEARLAARVLEKRSRSMKFTTGAMVGDLSGSIGSTTASHNRFGPYFRNRVIPVNPNTVRQQAVRAAFGALVVNWNDALTELQRTGWNTWAANTTIQGKDGSPINITGQNAFIRTNTVRLQIGEPRIDDAPIIFNNGSPVTSFEATEDAAPGVWELNLASTDVATTINIIGDTSDIGDVAIYAGPPVNNSRTFFKGPYQLIAVNAFAQGVAGSTWSTMVSALLGDIPPVKDQFRSLRFRNIYDDGRLSEPFEALALVTLAAA